MNIHATWHEALDLHIVQNQNAIFSVDLNLIPDEAGCYVFYNQIGTRCRLIYIGKAMNLCSRIKSQFNNVKLMMAIKNFGRGRKRLMYCTINTRGRQDLSRVVDVLERNLIRHAFTEEHELINIKGAKIHFHEIDFQGNRTSHNLFGRKILAPTE